MRRALFLPFVLISFALCPSPAWAVQTSHWTHTNEADFKKGAMHNVVATNFGDEEVQYIWALAQTPDGNLYVATGPHGKLFEVKGDKSKSVIMTSDESNLLSLLSDGKDLLYVGTDPNGLVYRVNRKSKEMFVLF